MAEIDKAALNQLVGAVGGVLNPYLAQPPYSADKAFTALNALSALAGFLIAGSAAHIPEVRRWFFDSVDQQIVDAQMQPQAKAGTR